MQLVEQRESVTITNQNEKIFGILHRPLLSETVPAVLICSGFGGNKCGKHRLYVRLAEELAKRGIAVLRFDYRGAGDSEGSFEDMTVEGKLSDVHHCLQFLQNDPQIDPKRIGLLGRSLGGALAVLTAQRNSAIKSLVLWAPVYNSVPWQKLWNAYQSNHLDTDQKYQIQKLPGIPNLKFLYEFFQLRLEDALDALKHVPVLHIEASLDAVIQPEHGKAYKLAREGIEHTRFISLPNSDHDFGDLTDQELAIKETCLWFQKTL